MRPATLVFIRPEHVDETETEFWRRQAGEWAKENRNLRADLSHERDLLEAAYDLIAHYRFPAAPCREDAVAEVVERFEEMLADEEEQADEMAVRS